MKASAQCSILAPKARNTMRPIHRLIMVLLATVSAVATASVAKPMTSLRRPTSAPLRNDIANTELPVSLAKEQHHPQTERNLQVDEQIDNVREMLSNLFSTAPEAWTTGQWILAAVLLFLALWCCGCCSGGRRYYRRGYHNQRGYSSGGYRSSHGGCCGCLQDLLMCFCCYELCCADCQDVPCCNLDPAYTGGVMASSFPPNMNQRSYGKRELNSLVERLETKTRYCELVKCTT